MCIFSICKVMRIRLCTYELVFASACRCLWLLIFEVSLLVYACSCWNICMCCTGVVNAVQLEVLRHMFLYLRRSLMPRNPTAQTVNGDIRKSASPRFAIKG